ncbi:MAG: fumarylacetoacetate hydrolase family protein, partial [Clostridiales bacterium]|nr:fumarylacetoacetate hydrolase family protein [Clostridiales bacterium]
MRIGRFEYDGRVFYGKIEGSEVTVVDGDIFGDYRLSAEAYHIDGLRILTPVEPPNIICVGLNYKSHAAESRMEPPERPVIFFKLTTAAAPHNAIISLPRPAPDEVDYEAELCAIIGRKAKDVEESDALKYVFGYTCGNDVSARDCQFKLDQQWARAKSFDGFCPIGPWIETELDPADVRVEGLLNGTVTQSSTTARMIFSAAQLVSYCSKNFTLLPGTVIMTGTPEGVGYARKPPIYLNSGDVFEVRISGVGSLVNTFT